ncbi:MAG: nuclear transport factor 2 family protein [Syntrophomonadaceae bacterium]
MDLEITKKTLFKLEEMLLQTDLRKSPQELGELLADDFIEIGSSGRTYDKQDTIEALMTSSLRESRISDFELRLITPLIALVTYRLVQENRVNGREIEKISLRSSIWRAQGSRWQILFHQGTPNSSE